MWPKKKTNNTQKRNKTTTTKLLGGFKNTNIIIRVGRDSVTFCNNLLKHDLLCFYDNWKSINFAIIYIFCNLFSILNRNNLV